MLRLFDPKSTEFRSCALKLDLCIYLDRELPWICSSDPAYLAKMLYTQRLETPDTIWVARFDYFFCQNDRIP